MATANETEKPKRTRHASYDVFKEGTADGQWMMVRAEVDAPSAKEAIKRATADMAPEDQSGVFATVRSGEFKTIERRVKVEPTDVWS